jgi:hypothetical protein
MKSRAGKRQNCKTWHVRISTNGMTPAKLGSSSMSCACKKIYFLVFKNVSKSVKVVRLKMWFGGEN